jgi:taurine transport system substrate-binding protein
MKRVRALAVVAVLTTVALAAAGCGSSGGTAAAANGDPAELRIGYQLIPNGDLIVKDQKWLEQALPHTKITWSKFDSGGDVNTAVAAGSLDIGLAGSSPVARGLAKPLSLAYQVPWIFDVIGDNEALVVRKGSGITSLAGLAGHKVATPFASTSHYSLLAALSDAGVPASGVNIVDLEPQDIQAAWTRGDIDAAYVWTPVLAELEKTGTTLVTSRELATKGHLTADLAVVTKAFSSKYPKALSAWLQAQDRAVKLTRSDKASAAAAIGRQLNISADEASRQLDQLVLLDASQQKSADYLGSADKPGALADNLHKAAEFLVGQGKLDAAPDLATYQQGLANAALAAAFSG